VIVVQGQAPQGLPAYPIQTTCPQCREVVVTVTEPILGLLTWIAAGGMIIIGLVATYYVVTRRPGRTETLLLVKPYSDVAQVSQVKSSSL